MKSKFKRFIAIAMAVVMILGSAPIQSLTGIDFGNLFGIEAEAASVSGADIVAYARQFLGKKYIWGANGPDAFDCSGFVKYVYKHFGIELPRNTGAYWSNPSAYGVVVGAGNYSQAKPGDVVSWSTHVAIYTSNGRCVEALNKKYGVTEAVPINSHTNGLNYRIIRIYGVDGSDGVSTLPDNDNSNEKVDIHTSGYYQVTCNSVKVRTGPSTGYAVVGYKYRGEIVEFDSFSGSWGRIKGTNNWSCLGNAYGVYYQKISSPKPNAPQLSATAQGNVPKGTNSVISWPAVANATGYKVYLNGREVQNSNSTTYQLKTDLAGEYKVHAVAYNSSYTSGNSNTVTINAKNPSTVKFLDWNGNVLNTQSVDYGKNAVSPEAPSREGYTFTGWDRTFTNVTSNLTVKATYKINTYTIKFAKPDPKKPGEYAIFDTQKVNYGDSALAPTVAPETGYVFTGWSSEDYKNVKANATIYAVCIWGNDDLPIVASLTSATRQKDGYYVYFDLTNSPNGVQRGRAVVTLKTSDGKLVYTTESAAFSVPSSGKKVGMEVFVPCEIPATIAEVIIVDSFSSGVPISEKVSKTVDQALAWSEWTEDEPTSTEDVVVESKTQYSVSNKEYSTGSTKTKDGWTLYGNRTESVGAWQGWYDGSATGFENESVKRVVEWRKVDTYATKTYYNYFHWKHIEYNDWLKYQPGWKYEEHRITLDYPLQYSWTGQSGDWYGEYWCPQCNTNNAYRGKCWSPCGEYTESYVNGTKQQYRYRDTTYIYNFYRWSDWSDWSDTVAEDTSSTKVKTRTVYRTSNGIENNEGELRTISGKLSTSYAGKQISLFVYKYDEASDFTNEFVGQSVIESDGSYSFTFKLREEPSVKTGDFTVAIGIEGTNNTIVIDTIEAPKATHTVVFRDWDGSIIETKTVTEGQTVELPANPSREGYTFVGWDSNLTNVKEDIEVNARYVINTYTVVFVDWIKQEITTKTYNHGDVIALTQPQSVYGYDFSGWEGIGDDVIATRNLILTAKYDAKEYNVKFYDFDGNVLSDQNVKFGESSEIPDDPEKDGYIFLGWDYNGDLLEVNNNVNAIPKFIFEETVETPVASVKSGSYETEQTVTLSCDTEDAVIYYTLDGSNPTEYNAIEYTKPITIDKTSQLRFIASSLGKNDSFEVSEYYAINDGNMTSEWMTYSEIPQFVLNNLSTRYNLVSADGYRYKDVVTTTSLSERDRYIADGWTQYKVEYSTPYSEWSKTKPELEDADYTIEEKDPDPVPTQMYKYTRYKYYDSATEGYVYSNKEVENTTGEWETLINPTVLKISGFISSTQTPIYDNDGEEWYNQTKEMVDVVPDYKLYRYRIKSFSLYKWTDWTDEVTDAEETRETQNSTVYQYTGFKSHVVTLVTDYTDGDYKFFNISQEVIDRSTIDFEIPGYDIEGFYTDADSTIPWDIENDVVTSDMTLYVKYSIKSYSVTFINSDGTVLSKQTVEYGESAVEPTVPVSDGNVFVKWDTDDYLCVCDDIVVKAVVKPEAEVVKVKLNRYTFKMMEGSMTQLKATVTPDTVESTAVVWTSSDYAIADVDHNGFVTAYSAGTVEIKATAIDGTYAICKIEVVEYENNSLKLEVDSAYAIDKDNGYLRGVKAGKNTVSEVKSNFANVNIVFVKDGVELGISDVVGTGTEIRLMDGDSVVDSVIAIVTGDATGDGYINNRDASYVTRYVVNKEAPSIAQLVAMDVNGDGSVNNRDASMVARYLVGKEIL